MERSGTPKSPVSFLCAQRKERKCAQGRQTFLYVHIDFERRSVESFSMSRFQNRLFWNCPPLIIYPAKYTIAAAPMGEIMEYLHTIQSPAGLLTVSSDGRNVCGLWIAGQKYFLKTLGDDVLEQDLPIFEQVRSWLDIYFSGREPDFMPPLAPKGSPFQQSIWRRLRQIPYGQTRSYGEIAGLPGMGDSKNTSPRAVGSAVGRNPISILIPCHRVVGRDGNLVGYAGGIDIKAKLLQLEGMNIKNHTIEAAVASA
jgi:methylated-DNA-[protein]-cysteine S-methyltransferase